MSVNLPPVPRQPLPIFRPSQYDWEYASLNYRQADQRYIKNEIVPDIVCAPSGTFGVKTLRITSAPPVPNINSNGWLVGYSTAGVYQTDLIQFYIGTSMIPGTNWLDAIVFIRPTNSRGMLVTASALCSTNSTSPANAIELSGLITRAYSHALCERFVGGFGDTNASLFNFTFPRGIYISERSTGTFLNVFIMVRNGFILTANVVSPTFTWTSASASGGANLVDVIFCITFRRICFVTPSIISGSSRFYYSTATSGVIPAPSFVVIPGTWQWTCICENLQTGVMVMGSTFSSAPYATATSIDGGLSWTVHTGINFLFRRLAYHFYQNIFVAVSNSLNPAEPRCAISPDGVNWTNVTLGDPTTILTDICYSLELNLLVACCSVHTTSNRIFTSPDGINWTERTTPNSNAYNAVRWFKELGMFVSVATTGTDKMIISYDGITWTQKPLNTSGKPYMDVMFSPRYGVMVYAHDGNYTIQRSRYVGRPQVNAQ